MEEKKPVNLINFGAELNEKIIQDLEEQHNIKVEQHHIKASLNLKKHSTYIQVHDLIEKNRCLFTDKDFVIVNLPGLPIYTAFLISEIHALIGKFPIIIECVKNFSEDRFFSEFKFKRLYDLDRERTQSRENYKQVRVCDEESQD